jgi:hypothetical protein
MKKLLILGTLLLSSCSAYRIEINQIRYTQPGTKQITYYTPAKRVGLMWIEHYNSFIHKHEAVNQIIEWQDEKKMLNSKPQYIFYNK